MYFSIKILIQANQNAILQINLIRSAKKIVKNLKQYFKKNKYQKLQFLMPSKNNS